MSSTWQLIGFTSMVGVWCALASISVSGDNPSRKVISTWVPWAPPKKQSGLEGWILRNPKNQALVLVATCG